MILFGGNDASDPPAQCSTVSFNDTWLLSNASGLGQSVTQWSQLFPAGSSPPVRRGHSAVYDPTSDRMIVFGGDPVSCSDNKYDDTWVLVNAAGIRGTPTWMQLSPTGDLTPSPRSDHAAIYDSGNNRMTIAGGYDDSSGNLSDVWVLLNANGLGGSPQWEQLLPTGGPPLPSSYRSVTYDFYSNRMMLFGGERCCSPVETFNDTWVLTNANGLGGTPTWIQLTPSGLLPVPRFGAPAAYDVASNTMTIFGGAGTSKYNDVWSLADANGLTGSPAWTELNPVGTPPAARGGLASNPASRYDWISGRLIVFGGLTQSGLANDAWVLSGLVASSGTPSSSPTATVALALPYLPNYLPTATPTLAPTATPTSVPTSIVQNGTFENGLTGWTTGGGALPVTWDNNPTDAHSGSGSALLGSPTYDGNCGAGGVPIGGAIASQTIVVPNATTVTLTFWYHTFTQDWTGPNPNLPIYDAFSMGIGTPSESHGLYYDGNPSQSAATICDQPIMDLGWRQHSVDLSSYAGQTITIYFANWNGSTSYWNTYTYLDDVAITVSE
jgi:hypothetical protein